jgi:hypothetical protein|tara:strand:+ start:1317 stop:1454 length:138 start_codon:yes stop_codon:yes gene_type:complete
MQSFAKKLAAKGCQIFFLEIKIVKKQMVNVFGTLCAYRVVDSKKS